MSFHFQMEDDCGENISKSFAYFSCMIFSSIKSLYYLMEDDCGENISKSFACTTHGARCTTHDARCSTHDA